MKFGKRSVSKIMMLTPETYQYLKDWAEDLHFVKGQGVSILVESLIRDAMQKRRFPKIHKTILVIEGGRGRTGKKST